MKSLAASFLILSSLLSVSGAETPNVIIILADDYGYGSAGCYGADGRLVQTPNIDRLAKEGRRFTDANTTSSVCSPTRYSVLTGRYCWRTSLDHEVLSTFSPLHIETTRLNMASLLKRHGYHTAAVGKWHLGYGTADDSPKWRTDYTAELSPGPLDIGFDYHFAVPSNHGDLTGVFVENRFVHGLRTGKIPAGMKIAGPVADSDDFQPTYSAEDTEGGKGAGRILDLDAPRRKNERVMKVLTEKATTWLRQQPKDKPFFLYFTPVAVHNPVTPDKDLAGKSAAGLYGDWIHELDRSVGRVLDTLDQLGAAQNTLVIFSSDNGGVFKPDNAQLLQTAAFKAGLRVNGALRGGKHDVWEGGFKVPFLVRWPGHAAPGSVCTQMISLADILATTAAITGDALPPASKAAEDSHNFLPAILGDPQKAIREDMIVHSAPGVFAIRKGPWKWIEGVPVEDIKPGARKAQADQFRPQLYNTHDDPAETTDASVQHPEIVKELSALLNRYRDGGYSRELPPPGTKVIAQIPALPPLAGETLLTESFNAMPAKPWAATGGEWQAHDGAVWGGQKKSDQKTSGACLRRAVNLGDDTLEYDLSFRGADRHSLRFGTSGGHTFRVVVSPSQIEVARVPDAGKDQGEIDVLARQRITSRVKQGDWQPLRIAFKGGSAVVQYAGTTVTAKHEVLADAKSQINLLVFGKELGFRNLRVVKGN
ncbi:MAG: arylsulfatase [Verrucomicrobiaceae bacterium]|nr:arylsulfatase [Verrucomicrobiaceae bacterium]